MTVTQQLAWQALAKSIRFCAQHRGTMTRIHRAYEKAAGRPINRLVVAGWLKVDRLKRHEPLFGSGLLLVRVARAEIERIRGEMLKKSLAHKPRKE